MPRVKSPTSAIATAEDRRWQTEEALRVMTRAEEIKKDSALMRDVKKLAADKQKMLSSVANGGKTSTSRTRK